MKIDLNVWASLSAFTQDQREALTQAVPLFKKYVPQGAFNAQHVSLYLAPSAAFISIHTNFKKLTKQGTAVARALLCLRRAQQLIEAIVTQKDEQHRIPGMRSVLATLDKESTPTDQLMDVAFAGINGVPNHLLTASGVELKAALSKSLLFKVRNSWGSILKEVRDEVGAPVKGATKLDQEFHPVQLSFAKILTKLGYKVTTRERSSLAVRGDTRIHLLDRSSPAFRAYTLQPEYKLGYTFTPLNPEPIPLPKSGVLEDTLLREEKHLREIYEARSVVPSGKVRVNLGPCTITVDVTEVRARFDRYGVWSYKSRLHPGTEYLFSLKAEDDDAKPANEKFSALIGKPVFYTVYPKPPKP